MVFKLGTLLHAKGFIINKLFDDGRIGHNHLPVQLLPKGYPLKYRPLVKEALEILKSENPSPIQVVQHRTCGLNFSESPKLASIAQRHRMRLLLP